jgi:uncharacterized protein (TIGR02246 family)
MAATIIAASISIAALPITAAAQTEKDSAAIRTQIEAYRNVWNTHESAALAEFFAEDADMVAGNLPAAHGRQAIQDWWGDYFARQEPERTINIDVKLIRLIASDVALANVATTTGGTNAQGKALLSRRARGTWLLRRDGGEWLISALRAFPTEEDSVELNRSIETAESLQPQIRTLVHNYENAFDSHDPAAISGFYTDDANIMVRNLPAINGRQAILEWWRKYFSKSKSDKLAPENWYNSMRSILIIDDINMITPDIARINITATGSSKKPVTTQSPLRYARATWVVVREAGGWKIAALWVLPSEEDRIIRRSSH